MTCQHEPEACAIRWILLGKRCCDACVHRPPDEPEARFFKESASLLDPSQQISLYRIFFLHVMRRSSDDPRGGWSAGASGAV
jgi:hypothetical protein